MADTDTIQEHTWQEEYSLMQDVEKIFKKWEKKLNKIEKGKEYHGEGALPRVPYYCTTNEISTGYNEWNRGGYYGVDKFMCIYLKVGTANLDNIETAFKVNSAFDVFKKITNEINRTIKKHGGHKVSDTTWHFKGSDGSLLYAEWEYGSSWCPIALINTKHKYNK